jgi:hypothetical protein
MVEDWEEESEFHLSKRPAFQFPNKKSAPQNGALHQDN